MAIKQDILNKYKELDWQKLLREDLGESGKLNEIDQNLQRMKSVFERILSYQSTLEQVPNYERTFESVLNQFVDSCNTQLLTNYSDVTQRQTKLAYVRQMEESYIGQLSPVFNYLQFVDPANNTKQQELERSTKELEQKIIEVDILTKKVQKAVQISGSIAEGQEVELYGKEFEMMAEGIRNEKDYGSIWKTWVSRKLVPHEELGNRQKASRNQFLMMVTIFLTVVLACIFVFGKQLVLQGEGSALSQFWNTILEQNVLLKIFLISAGGYLVAHFSRNYSAEMNMYYINKHRQMALNSHQRILDAVRRTETANESETKNAILLQVAKTMFDIQETGYLKNGNNPVPATQIIETVRSGIPRSN